MSDHIPFAMQEEIMKRVPTKSLMRFRSVSKPWKSLIDSPKFITDYSLNHTHQQHLLVSYVAQQNHEQKYVSFVGDDTFPTLKVSLPNPMHGLIKPRIVCSSRGVFALYSVIKDPCSYGRILKTVLWNPSVRKSVAIDAPYMEPPDSHIVIGFGVCPHTRDPKLVKINFSYCPSEDRQTILYSPWQVEVCTLSSRSWRSIPTINQPRKPLMLSSNHVVIIHEFIYWLAIDGADTHEFSVIVSFDLKSEEFVDVSFPYTLVHVYSGNRVLSKLKESLVVVDVVEEAGKRVCGVWMMEHCVSNSFAKLFSISLPDASIQWFRGFWKNDEPICTMRTYNDVDDVFVNELHSEHVSYIGIYGNGDSYRADSYMETLLLLDQ